MSFVFLSNRFSPLFDNARQNNIDLLRAIAVISVFIHHAQHIFGGNFPFLGSAGGWFGVQLFFVISGFLIAASAERYVLRDYAIHRFFRIVPAYLFFFFLVGIAAKIITFDKVAEDPFAFLVNLTFLQHLFPAALLKFNSLNVSWSLTVEVLWYVVMPLLLIGNKRIGRPSVLIALVVSTAWSFAAANHLLDFVAPEMAVKSPAFFGLFVNNNFIAQLVFFVFGAWIHFNRNATDRWNPLSTMVLALIVLMLMPYYFLFGPIFITGIAISLLLITALNSKPIRNKAVFVISETSYAIYLCHFPVILWVSRKIDVQGLAGVSLSVLLTLVLAMLSYVFIERPCIKLGRRLTVKNIGQRN